MLNRKAFNKLNTWYENPERKCLIVEGARQVGKTYIVRAFGKEKFKSFIELNFMENPSLNNIFEDSLDVATILTGIKLYMPGCKIVDGETLIFLDEIQECPKAITALKFLAEDKRISIICSGSALGIAYNAATPYPVGSVEYLDMYALDFEEFLWARGIDDSTIDEIKRYITDYDFEKKVPLAVHRRMQDFLHDYLVIGGMPEVVNAFINDNDYYQADQIQRRIYRDYILDIARYAKPDIKIKAERCYKSIPMQLTKENHKFQYGMVEEKGTSNKFESSIDWLECAHMAISVHNIKKFEYPLNSFTIDNNFRLYPTDIGLLIATYGYELKQALLEDRALEDKSNNLLLGTAKGGIYEALACDMLYKKGITDLHFFRNETGTVEIEFVIETKDGPIPIEVKAGRTRTKSLNNVLENTNVAYGYKFAFQNIGRQGKKITLPLYMLAFI